MNMDDYFTRRYVATVALEHDQFPGSWFLWINLPARCYTTLSEIRIVDLRSKRNPIR